MGACASARARASDDDDGEGRRREDVGVTKATNASDVAEKRKEESEAELSARGRRDGARAFGDPRTGAEDDEGGKATRDGGKVKAFDPLAITGFVDRRAKVNDEGEYEPKGEVKRRRSANVELALEEQLQSKEEIIRTMAQRLRARDWEKNEDNFNHLMNLPNVMPKRSEDDGKWLSREPPETPIVLSRAFGEAIRNEKFDWASNEDIAKMFHPDVEFLNVHGHYFEGRADVLKSLNESVELMSMRMRRSSARGDSKTLKFMKFTTAGPKYDGRGRQKEWSVWTMDYSFKLLLLTIKIREYYSIDDDTELIMKLARKRVH